MTRRAKLLHRLLSGTADRSFRFEDLCTLLVGLGFVEHRRSGSHRIFIHGSVPVILNLQPRSNGEAKPYQSPGPRSSAKIRIGAITIALQG